MKKFGVLCMLVMLLATVACSSSPQNNERGVANKKFDYYHSMHKWDSHLKDKHKETNE